MKKIIYGLIFCSFLAMSSQGLEAKGLYKKYMHIKDVTFKDGHFIVNRPGEEPLKLKTIRTDVAGVYYTKKDMCDKGCQKKEWEDGDEDEDGDQGTCRIGKKENHHNARRNKPSHPRLHR
jgi:hypothetical protein